MAAIVMLHKDRMVGVLLCASLESMSHQVTWVADANAAAHALGSRLFDVAILDLDSAPAGWASLAQLRDHSRRKDIGIVVISRVAHAEEVRQAAALGARGFIVAGQFTLENLRKQVERALSAPAGAIRAARPASSPDPDTPPRNPAAQARLAGAPQPTAGDGTVTRALPEPSGAELLRAIKPIISGSALREKLKTTYELKALSPTVARVLDLTRSAGTSVDSVVAAIKCDQAIALRIIKLANSAVYLRGDRVNTVKAAVLRIGLQQIQHTVTGIGVIDRFSNVAMEGFLNHLLFWEHALACAIISAQLAGVTKAVNPDTAFTTGLLHDVGRMLLAELIPEEYLRVLATAREMGLPLEQVEKRMLLTTHAEIMQDVLRAWNFPPAFIEPIAHHHSSVGTLRQQLPGGLAPAAVLALADRLAHALLLGDSGNQTVAPIGEYCDLLRIDEAAVQKIIETAEDTTRELKLAMLSSSNGAAWPSYADQVRQELGPDFRPLFVQGAEGPNACAILFRRLAEAGGPPTLGVVHLASPKDREQAGGALLQAEKVAGVSGLPLLLISPGAAVTLDAAITDRHRGRLAEPVSIPRLVEAIHKIGTTGPLAAAA